MQKMNEREPRMNELERDLNYIHDERPIQLSVIIKNGNPFNLIEIKPKCMHLRRLQTYEIRFPASILRDLPTLLASDLCMFITNSILWLLLDCSSDSSLNARLVGVIWYLSLSTWEEFSQPLTSELSGGQAETHARLLLRGK